MSSQVAGDPEILEEYEPELRDMWTRSSSEAAAMLSKGEDKVSDRRRHDSCVSLSPSFLICKIGVIVLPGRRPVAKGLNLLVLPKGCLATLIPAPFSLQRHDSFSQPQPQGLGERVSSFRLLKALSPGLHL